MRESSAVRDAVLGFYRGVTDKQIDRFDDIVSGRPETLVIGTAPGEWVTQRPRLRFGFEAEGLKLSPGERAVGYEEGDLGWFVDDPAFGFPDGSVVATRLTAVVRREDGRWRVLHLHFSVGVPDEVVAILQAEWSGTSEATGEGARG